MTTGTILVTGATGKVGRQVVAQLTDKGIRVRALTRNPAEANLPDGVEVVRGDLADPASLDEALDGVEKVFLVWPTLQADRAAPDVIRKIAAQARRIVYVSSSGAAQATGPVNASHAELERLIRETNVEWTFLRVGGFAANDLGWAAAIRTDGVVREPFGGWSRSVIHEADIAAVGVRALLADEYVGSTPELTGPETLTQAERVEIIATVLGRPLRFEEIPVYEAREQFAAWLPPETIDDTISEMEKVTAEPELVVNLVEEITGKPARTYRQWVLDHVRDFVPPTTEGLATAYLALIRQGEWQAIFENFPAPDLVRVSSDDMTGPPVELQGEEIKRNMERVGEVEEIHGVEIDGPFIGGDRFAAKFTFDSTNRQTGRRGTYSKISLYTVRAGRLVREEVFFDRPPDAR